MFFYSESKSLDHNWSCRDKDIDNDEGILVERTGSGNLGSWDIRVWHHLDKIVAYKRWFWPNFRVDCSAPEDVGSDCCKNILQEKGSFAIDINQFNSQSIFLCHNLGKATSKWPQAMSPPKIWGAEIPRSWSFYMYAINCLGQGPNEEAWAMGSWGSIIFLRWREPTSLRQHQAGWPVKHTIFML